MHPVQAVVGFERATTDPTPVKSGGPADFAVVALTAECLMYIIAIFMYEMHMLWSVADARAHFSEVLRAASLAPQFVETRGRRVAVVLDPREFERFELWQRGQAKQTIAEAVLSVREACSAEGYSLELPPRTDRINPFAGPG